MSSNKRYRKKPIVIEAYTTNEEQTIQTLEGPLKASIGDYIITGIRGEQYPCKPDVFERTYELVDSDEPLYRLDKDMSDQQDSTYNKNLCKRGYVAKVYVVLFGKGFYEDHYEEIKFIFNTEEKAIKYVESMGFTEFHYNEFWDSEKYAKPTMSSQDEPDMYYRIEKHNVEII